ncbi:hypothetical protein WN55_02322 [Dufourea novaeangliae]|uniref:Uncharacterized protein n=2 Tax=Dufourea novaeangliae TaxID=178035 RepID=A0A154PH94_DUFNO|nr:hypothetical protein WN55_02322 [Dufourea novaeangliae]
MCTLIQQNARNLETFDIIYALKVLFSMNVPSDTAVVQTLLQLTRVLINTLTISQILYLYHTLKVHNETPLAKALLYALHKVSHMQIHVELNRDDIYRTISVLKFACNTNNIQAIRHTLNILSRNQESLNLNDSISVLYALFLIPELTNSYRRLLDQVMNEIMNNHSMLKFNAISFLLAIITMKISEKGLKEFYNKQLINLLCQDCIDKNVNVSDGIKILKRLNKIGFSNIPLLDFLTEKCTEDSNILKTCSHQTIFHFIRALGIANYKPQHWFTVQSIIVNSFLNQNLPIGYVAKVTFYLLSLGCYDEQLLENIFTLYYCNHSHVKDVRTLNNILQLHQCVKSLYPCYDGITLSKNIIDALLSQTDRKIVSFSLADHLEEILGGNRYVKSNLRSKLGHHVEAIVVIQPDGSPMAINDYQDDITYIEDLVSPPDFHK